MRLRVLALLSMAVVSRGDLLSAFKSSREGADDAPKQKGDAVCGAVQTPLASKNLAMFRYDCPSGDAGDEQVSGQDEKVVGCCSGGALLMRLQGACCL